QGTGLWKYQWDAIHDPQNVLFAWGQGEEEGAFDPRIHEEILKESFSMAGISYDAQIAAPMLWGVGYGADGISISCDAEAWWKIPFDLDYDDVADMAKDYVIKKKDEYKKKVEDIYDFITDPVRRKEIIDEEIEDFNNSIDNIERTVESMGNYATSEFKIKKAVFVASVIENYDLLEDDELDVLWVIHDPILRMELNLPSLLNEEEKAAKCVVTIKNTNHKIYIHDKESYLKFEYLMQQYRARYGAFDIEKFFDYADVLESSENPEDEYYFDVDIERYNENTAEENLVYFEYRTLTGKPSILIRVLPESKVDVARLEENTEPTSKDITSELLMVVDFNGQEYEIRFQCDDKSTDIHFDNKLDITQVNQGWEEVKTRINEHDKIDKLSAFSFGIALHNLMDFYSHSNYVEMYLKYWENDLGKNLADFTLNDIPHWDEAVSGGFGQSKWYNQVRTGEFKLGEMMEGSNTHAEINKDKPSTEQGAKKIGDCQYTLYEIAYTAAAKHTAKFLKND
ncbi:hypothetical protein, partial [Anaerophaga thermohalophila]|uniref:hypothetical protein n=1 Tax=Anaerophaga thermohalophila TaxID=177400 RepID=UPI000237CAC2